MIENKWVKAFLKIVERSLFFALCMIFCSLVMKSMPIDFLNRLSAALQSTQDQANFYLLIFGFSALVVGIYECARSLPMILNIVIPQKKKPEKYIYDIEGA